MSLARAGRVCSERQLTGFSVTGFVRADTKRCASPQVLTGRSAIQSLMCRTAQPSSRRVTRMVSSI